MQYWIDESQPFKMRIGVQRKKVWSKSKAFYTQLLQIVGSSKLLELKFK